MPISIQIGQDIINHAGGLEAAIDEHRGTAAAADILLAHLHSINPVEAIRLAGMFDPA